MPKRSPSKRSLAGEAVEHALSECSQALSKLGGRVRYRPRKLPASNIVSARMFLEGIINRLHNVQLLIAAGDFTPSEVEDRLDVAAEEPAFGPKDEFEAAYEKERDPGC